MWLFKKERADVLSSFTFSDLSQLDQGLSTALATTREWRNSFIPINRIPLDVFSLIPTHLSSQGDRLRASFVCRHWRRILLQYAVLWSQLHLRKGEVYAKTMLKRAKGSALNITIRQFDPAGAMESLPPHTTQIGYIYFNDCYWGEIQRFSEINSGPLPLLQILRISAVKEIHLGGPDTMTPPSLPLFRNAVNLEKLVLHSEGSPYLSHFIFPNLTTLELSGTPGEEGFRASHLLDFLEASPMLQTVHVKVIADIPVGSFPRERVILLPNVETFSLVVSDGGPGYEIAARISCPSARSTTLRHERHVRDPIPHEIFPSPVHWDAIVRQYTKSPVERASLEITFPRDPIIAGSVIFRFLDAAVLSLGFQVAASDDEEEELQMPYEELHYEVFHQASRTIRDHPLLADIKRLYIEHKSVVFGSPQFPRFSAEVGRLFKSVERLEVLTFYGCDLHLFLNPSPNLPGFYDTERPMPFPQIRELVLSHPLHNHDDELCVRTLVELARSRHELGTPFERMALWMEKLPPLVAERLGPWVGLVECQEEMLLHDDF